MPEWDEKGNLVTEWDEKGNPVTAAGSAAASKAETIGATPWTSRNFDTNSLIRAAAEKIRPGAGALVPRGLPLPSLTQVASALPGIGAAAGGFLGGAGGTAVEPGGGTLLAGVKGAALGGAAGEAARQLAFRAMGGGGPQSSAAAAGQIAQEAAIGGAGQLTGNVLSAGLTWGGQRLMQSALKPGVAQLREYNTTTPKVVRTLLDNGVNVTQEGLDKLHRLLTANQADISAAVSAAKGSIPRETVAAYALPTTQNLSQQVNPSAALEQAGQTVGEFLNPSYMKLPAGSVAPPLSIPEAQAMKVGTYRQIGKSYGQMSSAAIETQKALARGLKEEIAAAVPKIADLNRREAALLAAQDITGHRVAIAGNRDPVGFAWVAHAPQTFLAALIDRSPVVKSMLAHGMYNSAGQATKISPNVIRAAVAALASGGTPADSSDLPAPQ